MLWLYVSGTADLQCPRFRLITLLAGLAATMRASSSASRQTFDSLANVSFDVVGSPFDLPTPGVAPAGRRFHTFANNHDLLRSLRWFPGWQKLILVRQPSLPVSGYARPRLVAGPKPDCADLPEVYLYDIGAMKPIFTGTQATWQNTNGVHFMSQNGIRHGGPQFRWHARGRHAIDQHKLLVQRFAERLT